LRALFKPYKVLLVISDQWKDPSSYIIEDDGEFGTIVSLLKMWGIPFDILRLDQQHLTINYFLDANAEPDYGCIVWDADQSLLKDQDFSILETAVSKYGISLLALFDRIKEPIIQRILGVRYKGTYPVSLQKGDFHPIRIVRDHFITRGMVGDSMPSEEMPYWLPGAKCMAISVQATVDNATVLATQEKYAQITVRDITESTKAVWIGGEFNQYREYSKMRRILRRALAYCIGYLIYKDLSNTAIIYMDDMGCAPTAYHKWWHFPTLSKKQIEEHLIKPLQEKGGILVLNVNPGFVDLNLRMIVPSWRQRFIDPFGTYQDYVSTKEGIDEGLALGVFEIQSHGWTHMQPDLDSPPGPWWDAPVDGEKAWEEWYEEFGDRRRGKEIPAITQRYHMKRSIEGIKLQFNVTPLELQFGGYGWSTSYYNHSWRIAASVGFGWCARGYYLGRDYVIKMAGTSLNSLYNVYIEGPLEIGIHDLDITIDSNRLRNILNELGDRKCIGYNELIAYTHTQIEVVDNPSIQIRFNYDPHYCQYFNNHTSTWILHLSDDLRMKLSKIGKMMVLVDSKEMGEIDPATYFTETREIEVPKGTGLHVIEYVVRD